ncbi:MAG: DMT family transporter [Candidatus Hatepunaea meridiana]|nr:DMT family transporter [Candidatus Hatepunaea meridiana]
MTNQTKAYIYTIITVLLWSTVASAFKIALQELDFVQLLFYASCFSLLSLLAVLVVQRKIHLLIDLTKRDLVYSSLLGLINPTIYYLILFKAYDMLPAQEAQPLNWTWPIMLTILSVPLLKQKLTSKKVIAISIAFLGVIVISSKGNLTECKLTNITGDLLAIGSSVFWALFWIFNIKDRRDPVVKLFYCFMFGCIYNFIIITLLTDFSIPSFKGITSAAYVGLFEMGISFILWLKALSLSRDSASVGIIAYITPFLSLVLIHFVVGETILISSIIGLILIVTGILFQMLNYSAKTTHNNLL